MPHDDDATSFGGDERVREERNEVPAASASCIVTLYWEVFGKARGLRAAFRDEVLCVLGSLHCVSRRFVPFWMWINAFLAHLTSVGQGILYASSLGKRTYVQSESSR